MSDKEKYTLKLIMGGMNPYRISKHLQMSTHGIYNRVHSEREKYIKMYGVPESCRI